MLSATGNKSSMVIAASARPQRASAIAAKKRVTDFAAKQQKDIEVPQMHAAICWLLHML